MHIAQLCAFAEVVQLAAKIEQISHCPKIESLATAHFFSSTFSSFVRIESDRKFLLETITIVFATWQEKRESICWEVVP